MSSAGDPESKDPWIEAYRKQKKYFFDSTIYDKNGNPIEFFNGVSVGASAGLGLFHGSLAEYDIFAPFDDFGKYYKFAWRVYAEKKFKFGLGAKLEFETGSLGGGRRPGKESLPVDFETEFSTINAKGSWDILNQLFSKDKDLKDYKFYLNGELGIGLTFYRSFSTWRPVEGQQGEVRDYVGYTVVDENPPTQRYQLDQEDSPAIAVNIPVGFTFGYRVNYKTDITFSYTLNNLLTDDLDTWDRDFSANDKYSYFGLGLRYNFNRTKSQYPKKKEKKAKEEKEEGKKWRLFGSKKEDVEPKDVNLEEPLESRKSNPITPDQADENLEEIRMKMFELQLKLFEMQYLLNGGDGEAAPAPQPAD